MSWQLLVDRGGTFTDVVGKGPSGQVEVRKLLSLTEGGDATARAAAGYSVTELRLGTTVATNALLERSGERVTLFTTRGFGDLLDIGSQERPDIFALCVRKRVPLHSQVVEIDERVLADGSVRTSPAPEEIRCALLKAKEAKSSVAVLFLNAHVNPVNEQLVEQIAHEVGVKSITLSHRVAPEIGAVGRGDTTVADAYLTPSLLRSVEKLDVGNGRVLCMQSSGGLTDRQRFTGKDALLSGPAGGVVATQEVGRLAGFPRVIGLDMGGTSTDVCRCDEQLERVYETVTDGVRIRAPALNIITVAAGGGSICRVRDGRFAVGPESAGAAPGPACYGKGGPATITDCNLILGRLRPEWFPHMELDVEAARRQLETFGDPQECAEGFLRVATESMAEAIRGISVARGYDPRDHALCAFGGAGGQHACELARSLGIRHVVVHPLAGVLSAWGLGQANISRHEVTAITEPWTTEPPFPVTAAVDALSAQGVRDFHILRTIDVRYSGADATLTVPWSKNWHASFEGLHEKLFGFLQSGRPMEIVAARAEAVAVTASKHQPARETSAYSATSDDDNGAFPLYIRDRLSPGAWFDGPALVVEDCATTVVESGWRARVDGHRQLILEDIEPGKTLAPSGNEPLEHSDTPHGAPDPVTLEVMGNRFMSIATQMGEHLRRVAHSTNIKERLDFSCALFDVRGQLVANAPHIPVHLGAIGETVRGLLARQTMQPGDAWLSNDPYGGGSHLPDLTVVSPIFREGQLAFLVANRGHHSDVGGIRPGSMPPFSTHIDEEGALFRDVLLLRDASFYEEEVLNILRAAGARGLDERVGDLRAQVACNVMGERLLHELCEQETTGTVQRWMKHVEENAADVMRDVISTLSGGLFEDTLDDGSRIQVDIRIKDGRALVDFSGTSPQQPGNRNAPRAVTRAAVLYVFRTLAHRPIPLNEGCMAPLDIYIPPGSLLDPAHPAAVVGGNVETCQRVVDVLYGALGKLAASQGTMNNLSMGDESFGYYETICGGAGAGYGFDGESAVHTHMTNTRITDPEVLEQRYPVVVKQFAIRRGSGGDGVWRGGEGVVRELEFLRPLEASILAERRMTRPFGLRAEAGKSGEDIVKPLGVTITTPGGGGYSPSSSEWAAMTAKHARQLFREERWTGPTRGIASDALRARVLVVSQAEADAIASGLGAALMHRTAPGVPWIQGAPGRDREATETDHTDRHAVNLATDAPLYARCQSNGTCTDETELHIEVGPDDVLLVARVISEETDEPAPPGTRWCTAPGRHILLDR
jgi:5-oxoprolinase (ATP-hydrolysing)